MKYIAGTLSGSTALIADAAHSLSDLLSDVVTLFVVDAARAPPDELHPYGRGRYEAVGSLSVAAVLLATAGGVGWGSLSVFTDWWMGAAIVGLSESGWGSAAVAACVASLVAKECLYHATVKVGNDVGSQTLIANAWHHRSDALSSVAALVGVGGSMAGMPWLDPASGLLVSAFVAKAGSEIGWTALQEIMERAVPDDETRLAVEDAAAATAGIVRTNRLRTRRMGPYELVDLRVEVDPLISMSAAHNIAKHLQNHIQDAVPSISEVFVHIAPAASAHAQAGHDELMRPHAEVEQEVRAALEHIPEISGVSHVITYYKPNEGIQLKVDIICDEDLSIKRACEIARKAKRVLCRLPNITSVDVDLELDV